MGSVSFVVLVTGARGGDIGGKRLIKVMKKSKKYQKK
jgi:hypothetical protein